MRTDELVATLATDLRPVRRMPAPHWQALAWLGTALAVTGVAVAWTGPRHDLHDRMLLTFDVAQWCLSVGVGITAAFAAAMLARPDRSPRWAWLPMPLAAAWLGTLGWGCMADMDRMGKAAHDLSTSWSCLCFVAGLGMPLAAALLLLLRHAGPVRPTPVLLLGALASAAVCSAALSLIHHLDAALMVLVWHGAGTLLVLLAARLFGPRLLRRPPDPADYDRAGTDGIRPVSGIGRLR